MEQSSYEGRIQRETHMKGHQDEDVLFWWSNLCDNTDLDMSVLSTSTMLLTTMLLFEASPLQQGG